VDHTARRPRIRPATAIGFQIAASLGGENALIRVASPPAAGTAALVRKVSSSLAGR
jgi:hypothetical protein